MTDTLHGAEFDHPFKGSDVISLLYCVFCSNLRSQYISFSVSVSWVFFLILPWSLFRHMQ